MQKKRYKRENELFTVRMKLGIKKELDDFCENRGVTRNNFIINCVVKELAREKEALSDGKFLKTYASTAFLSLNNR